MIEEGGPLCRKLHVPRRSLDKPAAKSPFKTLQLSLMRTDCVSASPPLPA